MSKIYQIAPITARLFNFVIDQMAISLLLVAHKDFGIDLQLDQFPNIPNSSVLYILLFNSTYYILFELLTQKTLGKIITRTRVVDIEGEKPKLKDFFIRTLLRNVPLEPLTYLILDIRLHDRFSKTEVVLDSYKTLNE